MLWVSSSIKMSPKSHELEDPELVNVVKTTFQPILCDLSPEINHSFTYNRFVYYMFVYWITPPFKLARNARVPVIYKV